MIRKINAHALPVYDVSFSPDGKLLAAGLNDGTTNVWNVEGVMVVRRFGGSDDTFSVRFVADGSVLCGVGGEAKVILWDTSDLTGAGTGNIIGYGTNTEFACRNRLNARRCLAGIKCDRVERYTAGCRFGDRIA